MKNNSWLINLAMVVISVLSVGISASIKAQDKSVSIQVASYLKASDAEAEVKHLKARGLDAYWVKSEVPGMGTRYRVRIGHFADQSSATAGAATACGSRAFKQFVIASGDQMPPGVGATNCAAGGDRQIAAVKPVKKASVKEASATAAVVPVKELATAKAPTPPATTANSDAGITSKTTGRQAAVRPEIPAAKPAEKTAPKAAAAKPEAVKPAEKAAVKPPPAASSTATAPLPKTAPVKPEKKAAETTAPVGAPSVDKEKAAPAPKTPEAVKSSAPKAQPNSKPLAEATSPVRTETPQTARPQLQKAKTAAATTREVETAEPSAVKVQPRVEKAPAARTATARPAKVETAASPSETKSVVDFEPGFRPADIVNKAVKYANGAKPVSSSAPALKTEAPSTAAPSARSDSEISISNPKWKVSQPGIGGGKNLKAVYFVDAWTGWAAGDEGTLFHTTDGGKKWNQIRSNAFNGKTVDVRRLQFANENRGWMLAETRNNPGEQPQSILLTTNDGGRIWLHMTMPGIESFCFVDDHKGWAVGENATIVKTTDGGIRWRPVLGISRVLDLPSGTSPSDFAFSDVYFLNSDIGWAVGNYLGKAAANNGSLFMTVDGGESWQRIPIALMKKSSSGKTMKGKLLSVRFTSLSNGVISGEMEDAGEKFAFTLKTNDGGETWEQTRVPSATAQTSHFLDPTRGWSAASVAHTGAAQEMETKLLRTINGGKSWETELVSHGGQIRSIFFLSPTRGWAVGDRGLILSYDAR